MKSDFSNADSLPESASNSMADSPSKPPSDSYTDSLPKELDPGGYVGPYLFPNNNRRKIPGAIYIFLGTVFSATWAVTISGDTPLINYGFLIAGLSLVAIGLHHIYTGWSLKIDEKEAFLKAVSAVGFPVGHASAQMGWRGWLSRPTWRVLVYSNEAQPRQRGLILVDGSNGSVLECLIHDNPEQWTDEMREHLEELQQISEI